MFFLAEYFDQIVEYYDKFMDQIKNEKTFEIYQGLDMTIVFFT